VGDRRLAAYGQAAHTWVEGPGEGHDAGNQSWPEDGRSPFGWSAEDFSAPPTWGALAPPAPAEPAVRQPDAVLPGTEAMPTQVRDAAEADLRCSVAARLKKMNWLYAENAWQLRRRDPLGPHALAFLYCRPDAHRPGRLELGIATRLFLDAPDVEYLPRLLFDVAAVLRERDGHPVDVREIASRVDPVAARGTYVGVAVSSLDTPTGTWKETRERVEDSLDIPGPCYAYLADGTALLVDRGGKGAFTDMTINSTHSLDVPGTASGGRWTWKPDLITEAGGDTQQTWEQLWDQLQDLHRLAAGEDPQ